MLWSSSGGTPFGRSARLGLIVIVLLLAAWAVVLIPPFGFRRSRASAEHGIRSFESFMSILASTRSPGATAGRWIMVPGAADRAGPPNRRNRLIRRRRQTFVRLLATAGITGVLGLIPHLHSLLMAHLACDAGLIVFATHLRRVRRSELQQRRVVHRLHRSERSMDELIATQSG